VSHLAPWLRRAELDAEHERMVAAAVVEAQGVVESKSSGPAPSGGDRTRLRGIPVVGGVGGAMQGSRPDHRYAA
jgi:hypothetical protein